MVLSAIAYLWRARPNKLFFALPSCLVLTSLLSGCATPQLDSLQRSERQGLPERAEVPAVPFFAQDDFYCGPAALAMTLAWSGLQVTDDQIAPLIYTPGREGTLQSDVITGARRYGRLAVPVRDLRSLLGEIAAGTPVLVLQNLALDWYPQWHYAVAIGYDLDASTLTLNSGTHEELVVPLATFERTWARGDYWALVITPPTACPQAPARPRLSSRRPAWNELATSKMPYSLTRRSYVAGPTAISAGWRSATPASPRAITVAPSLPIGAPAISNRWHLNR